jgi:hypothetical protein
MLYYFAIYVKDIEDYPDQEASGVFIRGRHRESILFDHRTQTWRFDPETVGSWMAGSQAEFRQKVVDRAEAERIAMVITNGASPLPSEETILQVFAEAQRRQEQG